MEEIRIYYAHREPCHAKHEQLRDSAEAVERFVGVSDHCLIWAAGIQAESLSQLPVHLAHFSQTSTRKSLCSRPWCCDSSLSITDMRSCTDTQSELTQVAVSP
jgi:hypothetical protein